MGSEEPTKAPSASITRDAGEEHKEVSAIEGVPEEALLTKEGQALLFTKDLVESLQNKQPTKLTVVAKRKVVTHIIKPSQGM